MGRLTFIQMDDYVLFNKEFKLAICRVCETGVWGDVLRHFSNRHKETWRSHKKELKAHITSFKLTTGGDMMTDCYPTAYEIREPIWGIAVLDGWSCTADGCAHLSVSETCIRQHCREGHDRTVEGGEKMWVECRLQSLFGRPHLRSYYFSSSLADN
jgi:hypothetical protein